MMIFFSFDLPMIHDCCFLTVVKMSSGHIHSVYVYNTINGKVHFWLRSSSKCKLSIVELIDPEQLDASVRALLESPQGREKKWSLLELDFIGQFIQKNIG